MTHNPHQDHPVSSPATSDRPASSWPTPSWKATLPCSRAEGEGLADQDPAPPSAPHGDSPDEAVLPVIMTSEPDESCPDAWQLDVYFDHEPSEAERAWVRALAPSAPHDALTIERLEPQDWVTLSQAGLEPVRIGRFHVRTPEHGPPGEGVDLVIPAGLAFGTGQHATTSACLGVLDALADEDGIGETVAAQGRPDFRNILDLGTGTGLLAFAAAHLWRGARVTASDIDPVAIAVAGDNAALNRIAVGEGAGAIAFVVADGLAAPVLAARAPYDLIIANILAGPLIDMAPAIAAALAPGGVLMLAGLLDSQEEGVAEAYRTQGMALIASTGGEWPCLMLTKMRGVEADHAQSERAG